MMNGWGTRYWLGGSITTKFLKSTMLVMRSGSTRMIQLGLKMNMVGSTSSMLLASYAIMESYMGSSKLLRTCSLVKQLMRDS